MLQVRSSDDVDVVVHDLAGAAGSPLLLVAHATGFHGCAYLPLAEQLAPPFHVLAMDFRGHGDTPQPAGLDVDWNRYSDDATAVLDHLLTMPGGENGIVGFGHSMGGASLLVAATRRPDAFRRLVVFEPIAHPPHTLAPGEGPASLIAGARRRRRTFASFDEAIANFASKPPLDAFDPAALDAYVRHGFSQDTDGIRIKCDPEIEARTFELGRIQHTWDALSSVQVPVDVISGKVAELQPSWFAEAVADQLPRGRFVLVDDLDHFGPFTHPARVAALVQDGGSR